MSNYNYLIGESQVNYLLHLEERLQTIMDDEIEVAGPVTRSQIRIVKEGVSALVSEILKGGPVQCLTKPLKTG